VRRERGLKGVPGNPEPGYTFQQGGRRSARSLPTPFDPEYVAGMFGDGFEQATILGAGPDGLTRVIVRSLVE
jgi:hypothetical protein